MCTCPIISISDFEQYIDIVVNDLAKLNDTEKIVFELKATRGLIANLPQKINLLLRGAVIAPIFLEKEPARIISMNYSFYDYNLWLDKRDIAMNWPYMRKSMFLAPDFSGKENMAEKISKPFSVECVLNELKTIITKNNTILYYIQELFPKHQMIPLIRHVSQSLESAEAILNFENLRCSTLNTCYKSFAAKGKEIVNAEIQRIKSVIKSFSEFPVQRIKDDDLLFNSFVLNEKLKLLENIYKKLNSESKSKQALTSCVEDDFHRYLISNLPEKQLYDFRKEVLEELKRPRFDPNASPEDNEINIGDDWSIALEPANSISMTNAVESFVSYMKSSFNINIKKVSSRQGFYGTKVITIGTVENFKEYGKSLKGSKDYQLIVEHDKIVICGYDIPGAIFGLYNLEAEMNLREAPFLVYPRNQNRHSLYQTRMTFSCLGWMEWPDEYLEILPRYGIDSIFISAYANITGNGRYRGVGHIQSPDKVRDIIQRAEKYGLKIYCQFITQTGDLHVDEKNLIRNLIREFPEVKGYILLTEGFGGGTETIGKIARTAHEMKPDLEIIPWNYNGPVLPDATKNKLDFIRKCPTDTIPMITWAKGCKLKLGDEWRYVYDYSISTVGPSEVWAEKQIKIAQNNGIRNIYARADGWNNWQFGTLPYLPFPQQWIKRFKSLHKHGITGTLDSWTYGFSPNFIAELKYWFSWSNAPKPEELLMRIAKREFGDTESDSVIKAWKHFSNAITLVPDTGHGILCNACAAPLFFCQPERKVWQSEEYDASWNSSFYGGNINPYWPYVPQWAFLFPDFSNQCNKAELYAKNYLAYFENMEGEKGFSLDTFLKNLRFAAEQMAAGLSFYRKAALTAPEHKKKNALSQVLIAEQIYRMLLSDAAVLEFEDLRFRLHHAVNKVEKSDLLNRMTKIAEDELSRTIAFSEAARLDSRIGFECEADYFYTPYVFEQKIAMLNLTLSLEIPDYARKHDLRV